MNSTVNGEDLLFVLKKLRDLRAWAVHTETDPWAFRQALVMVMELDTAAALERGVSIQELHGFDIAVRADFRSRVEEEP